MEYLVTAIVTPALTALLVWLIERSKQAKDDLREEAEDINIEVNSATMELAYATAVALKRGKPNGEVESAITAYNNAKKKQDAFNEKVKAKVIK